MIIDSHYGFKWNVLLRGKELSDEDKSFIRTYSPQVYWNDVDCHHWCFDTKLPSGRWLENIFPNNELTEVKALIL